MSTTHRRAAASMIAALTLCSSASAAQSSEERSLTELRNTVVNLLQALVERGVVTREQAEALVADAQKKAEAEAAALQAQEQAESGAVRVPYVPEIVKDEIRRQVAAELAPQVTQDVIEQAQSEQWGVPGALPDWIRRIRWSGDVRVRGQNDTFAEGNGIFSTPDGGTVFIPPVDPQSANEGGGAGRAGSDAFFNVTEDRNRMRARVRLGLEAELGYGWGLGMRLTSGNLRDPVSTNQTLGNMAGRYQTGLDLAYARWYGNSATGRHVLNFSGGRLPNPWLSNDLVWDPDLTFEGVALNYRLGLMRDDPYSHFAFVTLGAFPLQEVELSKDDKWLYGAQLGFDWKFSAGSRMRFGIAYYHYDNIVGRLNVFGSNLLDFTAPAWLQRGNSLFDIRNDDDGSTNLFALAADYHLANATLSFDWRVSSLYRLALNAEYVQNIGFDEEEVLVRANRFVEERNQGYQAEINFGSTSMARNGAWRAFVGYRYVERDATLDAFTDSDFHLGGTDARGYFAGAEYAFTARTYLRLRYLTADEIDGPPLGVDVLQLDLNASF